MPALRHRPLRVKLSLLIVVLMSVGLFISSLIATTALSRFLLDRVDEQLVGGAKPFASFPSDLPPVEADHDKGPRPPSRFYITVLHSDGRAPEVIGTPDNQSDVTPDVPAIGDLDPIRDLPTTVGSLAGDIEWRLLATPRTTGDAWVVVAYPLTDVRDTVHRLVLLQLAVGLVIVVLAAGFGYVIVRRNLRPLDTMATTTQHIADGDLTLRVPEDGASSEVDVLAHSFNTMVGRIEESFAAQAESESQARASEERMRLFVADASHELRTPLTSIRGFAELAVEGSTDSTTAFARIESEAIRMGLLVDELTLLARMDQGRPLAAEPVDVARLVSEAVTAARVSAPGRAIELDVPASSAPTAVTGDAERLRQVLDNLLSNAVRHTPDSALITVTVRSLSAEGAGTVQVDVANGPPGMSPETAARVFDRFYQADPARSSTGSGLGLSIARAIVTAHRGTITLVTDPNTGSTFTVSLPIS